MKQFIIITTINSKSRAILEFEKRKDWHIVVVGDTKSQPISSSENLTFLPVEEQLKLDYRYAGQCPFNHYARKNIGYLYAIEHGAEVIFDTDDDNIPYEGWDLPGFSSENAVESGDKFINLYRHFTGENIWPRGFPLDELQKTGQNSLRVKKSREVKIGVWQGLTDDEPDTDAIYWLVLNKKIKFEKNEPLYLPKGHFCPINSQNTFWRREVFPYLYLPATVSFRFTDILRGYIAQGLMGQQGFHIGFTKATVYQERNPHNLMKDFADEVDGYIHMKRIVEIIENVNLSDDLVENMRKVYRDLHSSSLVGAEELTYLNLWWEDYNRLVL
jgi:hypothetical protein